MMAPVVIGSKRVLPSETACPVGRAPGTVSVDHLTSPFTVLRQMIFDSLLQTIVASSMCSSNSDSFTGTRFAICPVMAFSSRISCDSCGRMIKRSPASRIVDTDQPPRTDDHGVITTGCPLGNRAVSTVCVRPILLAHRIDRVISSTHRVQPAVVGHQIIPCWTVGVADRSCRKESLSMDCSGQASLVVHSSSPVRAAKQARLISVFHSTTENKRFRETRGTPANHTPGGFFPGCSNDLLPAVQIRRPELFSSAINCDPRNVEVDVLSRKPIGDVLAEVIGGRGFATTYRRSESSATCPVMLSRQNRLASAVRSIVGNRSAAGVFTVALRPNTELSPGEAARLESSCGSRGYCQRGCPELRSIAATPCSVRR